MYRIEVSTTNRILSSITNIHSYKEAKQEYHKQLRKLQSLSDKSRIDLIDFKDEYRQAVNVYLYIDRNDYFKTLLLTKSFVLTDIYLHQYIIQGC